VAPTFPARDFVITDFGAKPDNTTDCTDAIRKAIAECHAAGGGRVVVPPGKFLTGAIHLKSNVNLHVSDGATLLFQTDAPKYYPVVFTRWEGLECMNYSPLIYAFEQENVAVTGKGTLDGQADNSTWWSWNPKGGPKPSLQKKDRDALFEMGEAGVPVEQRVFGPGHFLRPNFIQPYRCKNVLIEDVTILRSPMWEIHPVLCTNVTVRGVQIITHGPNNDGCDPESSRDVLIENCLFDTGDDCIAIKSGRNNDGRRVNVPSENLIIRNCVMKDGHGGVTIGSEISGGCRNVFAENCRMDSPELDRALRLKTNAKRGGVIENIYMRNVQIGQVKEAVLAIDFKYEEGEKGEFLPTVRNVVMENITSEKSRHALKLVGFTRAPIRDVVIRNSTFRGVEKEDIVENVEGLVLENVKIERTAP